MVATGSCVVCCCRSPVIAGQASVACEFDQLQHHRDVLGQVFSDVSVLFTPGSFGERPPLLRESVARSRVTRDGLDGCTSLQIVGVLTVVDHVQDGRLVLDHQGQKVEQVLERALCPGVALALGDASWQDVVVARCHENSSPQSSRLSAVPEAAEEL